MVKIRYIIAQVIQPSVISHVMSSEYSITLLTFILWQSYFISNTTQHVTEWLTLSVMFACLHINHLCLSVPIVCCLYFLDVLIVNYFSVLSFLLLVTKVQFFYNLWWKLITPHKVVILFMKMQMKTMEVVVSMEQTRQVMYILCNIEVCSCNHCCNRKTISIPYSENDF